MAGAQVLATRPVYAPLEGVSTAPFRVLHALIAYPSTLFLLTLTAMLFRPPDLRFYGLDRIALASFVCVVVLRACVVRQSLRITGPLTWPLLGLLLLALADLLSSSYEAQNWSVFAAKWVVPFVFYHLVQLVLEDETKLHQFETFCLIVLAYLSLTAIFFLTGNTALIFPRCILNENIGIHADRARGPFLQAVANGVAMTLLGLVALDSFRRERLKGLPAMFVFVALPFAILATKTRSVWLSFTGAVVLLPLLSQNHRIRRACLRLIVAAAVVIAGLFLLADRNTALADRLEERSPVEFRLALYRAGWEMFQEHPVFGWPSTDIQPELQKRVDGFRQNEFFFHNSYLEVTVNHGLIGLALYLWLLFEILRVGSRRKAFQPASGSFMDAEFRELWPVLIGVYAFNACFVVMNYQFVNALLFALAGILAAQNRHASWRQPRERA